MSVGVRRYLSAALCSALLAAARALPGPEPPTHLAPPPTPCALHGDEVLSAGKSSSTVPAPLYVSPSPSDLLVATPPPASYLTGGINSHPQQDVDVLKHIYVHVAPEDPVDEQPAPQALVPSRKAKKHYKIVFIKTPNASPSTPVSVVVPPADEEKTLIYVLSKRPEFQQQVVLSTPVPTAPSKPEVFFIRYKAALGLGGAPSKPHSDLLQKNILPAEYGPPGHDIPTAATSYVSQSSNRMRRSVPFYSNP